MSENAPAPLPVVLIAEDDYVLRMVASDIFRDEGFAVLEAESAEVAFMLLESAADVHLLFTDVQMPGAFDGLELVRRVHGRWPNIRVVVTSGQTSPDRDDIPDNGRFLAKPYRSEDLMTVVCDLLGR